MSEDAFFIGWLPVPASYRRLLLPLAAALLIAAGVTAAAVAFAQRAPGMGKWDDEIVTLDGLVFSQPYAMLRVPGDEPRTILLVEDGKFGAAQRVSLFTPGEAVRVRGTLLRRDGRQVMELLSGDEGMTRLGDEDARRLRAFDWPAPGVAEQVTLRGEIIDPKCYLGAMRPGGGKTHKACAMLCVSGGIPPMLVTREANGAEAYYLLTTSDGGPANERVLPYVGDAVKVTGAARRDADLTTLRVDAIRR